MHAFYTCTCCPIILKEIAGHARALKRANCVDAGLVTVVFTCHTFISVYKQIRTK